MPNPRITAPPSGKPPSVQNQLDALLLDTLTTGAATQEQIDLMLLGQLDLMIVQEDQQAQIDALIIETLNS